MFKMVAIVCYWGKIHIQKQNKTSDSLLLPANTEPPDDLTVSDRQQRREAIQHAPTSGMTSQAEFSPLAHVKQFNCATSFQ